MPSAFSAEQNCMLLTGERKTTPQNQNVWFANVCHKTTHLSTELHHQAQATVFHWRMSSAICRQIPFRGRLRFHDIYLKRNCMKTAGVFSSVFRTGIHYIYIYGIQIYLGSIHNCSIADIKLASGTDARSQQSPISPEENASNMSTCMCRFRMGAAKGPFVIAATMSSDRCELTFLLWAKLAAYLDQMFAHVPNPVESQTNPKPPRDLQNKNNGQ